MTSSAYNATRGPQNPNDNLEPYIVYQLNILKTMEDSTRLQVEENRKLLEENRKLMEENKKLLEENKKLFEEKRTVIEGDWKILEEKRKLIEEDQKLRKESKKRDDEALNRTQLNTSKEEDKENERYDYALSKFGNSLAYFEYTLSVLMWGLGGPESIIMYVLVAFYVQETTLRIGQSICNIFNYKRDYLSVIACTLGRLMINYFIVFIFEESKLSRGKVH